MASGRTAVDTPYVWELNIWYHTLNCGYTTRISGETDFPCIYGERVGLGRGYVKLSPDEPLDFDHWVDGIRDGRSYCTDGLTHLIDFQVNGQGVGEPGPDSRNSVVAIKRGDNLAISCKVAGLLDDDAEKNREDDELSDEWDEKPYWAIERARVAGTRQIPIELIVNGQAVEKKLIEADGHIEDVEFEFQSERSSWVAIRVLPAAHTNPVFVEVDGEPIRASKRSAQWCLDAVDRCWESKQPQIREGEREAAKVAYDHARAAYRQILEESYDDTAAVDTDD
jgi:hypothetical protein